MSIETLILLVLCGVLGWQLHAFYTTYRMLNVMKALHDLRQAYDEENTSIVHNANHMAIEVIQEQEVYLVYDDENNFICQGKDLEEAAKRFRDRTNNSMGEFTLDDKKNCFYDGEHLDHTQFRQIKLKA